MNIYKRGFVITKNLIGKDINIHNGQKFISVLVTKDMVGHKFGEFSFTRFVGYKNKELLKTKKR